MMNMQTNTKMDITRGLIIAAPWIGYILEGRKDWKMRSQATSIRGVRRQGFWHQRRLKLRESSAHLVDCIMRRACCDASVAFRVSFV